ncbi:MULTISPECIES: PAS domain S-box protein [Salinibaculum]|uniref:PAS domain S-box protein n=1 Tax=Salinibaculum TaxID=2732368 RepID=UPI0030CF78EA
MTDQSAGEENRHTIQLLVHGDSDRMALADILDRRYEIVEDDSLQPADCYLIDERMVPTYREELRARKREAHPTFTPALVLQREGSNGRVPLTSEQNGNGPPFIDEVVSAPTDRTTLFRRVDNLLARREQSVELSQRYEDLQTRFQRLFNSTNDAIFVVAPSGDEITECNPAASELVGYPRDELLSISPIETIHADDRERFQSFLQDVQETGRGSTDDLTCRTKHGENRRLEVSAATLEDSRQSPIIISARDITTRKAYERELELKSRAMDEAPIGIIITDPDRADDPMIYVNNGFQEVTGYSEAEALGRNCRFLQGEETRDEPVAAMRKAVDDAEAVSVELRNYRKDTSQFWNRVSIAPVRDDAGNVTNYIGFQEDITERKEREMDLQLFKKAVENAGHAVFITDREGTIEYVNPVFEARSGYTRKEAVGRTPRILKSGKQDEEFYERMWQTILSGEQWDANLINQRKNGELYHVEQTISPIANDSGEITHFVTIESDVTNRRLRKQQLDVLNRVLRHNLKNGMNVIQSRAELLRDSLGDDESQGDIRAIEERADALAMLGDKAGTVRSLFENEVSAETTTNVTELVNEVGEAFSEEYPTASLTLTDLEPLYARADHRLKLALKELLDNAVVHNDKPVPEVTVTIRPSSERRSEDWLDIEITDNGPGIPDQELETIKRGEETPLQHGTGLGLWIVYWAVSLFGGEVTFVDTEGPGTGIVLSLPRMSADSAGQETAVEQH